ncbi:MAG: murein hydrolase activator EnvC family protein [Gemmatimonadota bacterium]
MSARRSLPVEPSAAIRPGALVVLALLVPAVLPLPASSQEDPEDPIQERIRESEERLEEIRRERERLRQELDRLTGRVTTAREELQNLEGQIDFSTSAVAELEVQTGALQENVDETTVDMIRTRDQLTARRTELRARLRQIYKRGPLGSLQVLLAARSFSDLLNRYKYLQMVSLYDRMLVRQVGRLEQELARQRDVLGDELLRLQRLRSERRGELRELEQLGRQHEQRLAGYRQQASRTEAERTRLARQEAQERERLQNLMAELERARRESERESGEVTTSSLTTSDLGQLEWPVEGEVLYRFGPETRNGNTVQREGIGIGAEEGTPVRAVSPGTVRWAAPRGAYGPSVIVGHGGGYYSVYLYMSSLRVEEGQSVRAGQVLGDVGGRGSREGPHLEFQIWAPGARGGPRTVDPVEWLRDRPGGGP